MTNLEGLSFKNLTEGIFLEASWLTGIEVISADIVGPITYETVNFTTIIIVKMTPKC